MRYEVAGVDELVGRLWGPKDVDLVIPQERHRPKLERNVEKALRKTGASYARTKGRDYVVLSGVNCFTIKIKLDGSV